MKEAHDLRHSNLFLLISTLRQPGDMHTTNGSGMYSSKVSRGAKIISTFTVIFSISYVFFAPFCTFFTPRDQKAGLFLDII